MKFTSLIFILLVFVSCAETVELSIYNDTTEIAEIRLISNDLIYSIETIYDQETGKYFSRGRVSSIHKLNVPSCRFDTLQHSVPDYILFEHIQSEELCYSFYNDFGSSQELIISVPPNKRFRFFYGHEVGLKGADLSSVDSLFIKTNNTEFQLTNAEKIKSYAKESKHLRDSYQIRIGNLVE